MTVKPNKGVRFFNAGDRLNEPLTYSLQGLGDIHAIARFVIDAPSGDYFNVPTELKLVHDGTRIPVDFPATIVRKFGDRGIVMVDDEFVEDPEGQTEDVAIAANDKAAKDKGEALWNKYLDRICKRHIDNCQQARAAGGWPRAAEGFTKRALQIRGWQDPAEQMLQQMKTQGSPTAPDANVAVLQAQVATLLETNKKQADQMQELIDAAKLKKADKVEAALAKSGKKRT